MFLPIVRSGALVSVLDDQMDKGIAYRDAVCSDIQCKKRARACCHDVAQN
ncbi:protein of unknown function [Pseudodesulfovibrio profundus]|uniref:Uncharacterized protein n=1 Tax=Pseudodesulfovibrio profundus TaxID=57320 RepID=A0A2C8F849_9BACT|nr:hypothetical protein [Pseudodesulfovibrio profundus]SOB58619.1 protein of unknown function [Pseudodesulfovibrio profundus]